MPPLIRHMTQEKINIFSGGGGETPWAGHHTSVESAMAQDGMPLPVASARMSIGYATAALRQFFGDEIFNHQGKVDLKFIRPVYHGDTVTVKGRVTEVKPEGKELRVILDIWCENQKGNTTAAGMGSALLPG